MKIYNYKRIFHLNQKLVLFNDTITSNIFVIVRLQGIKKVTSKTIATQTQKYVILLCKDKQND